MSNDRSGNRSTDGLSSNAAGAASSQDPPDTVEMPAPTIWPLVLALGITLALAGVVTSFVFSAGGALLAIAGLGGWIRELLPEAGEEQVALLPPQRRAPAIQPKPPAEIVGRARLPETVPTYSAGIGGGLAGGAAMAAVAFIYGMVSGRGIWYPVNLLAAMLMPGTAEWNLPQLEQFHAGALVLGILIHGASSVAVGLLFSLLLPMLPGNPLFWGGVVGPLLWSGGVYASMGVLNPVMNSQVDWPWFIVSQFAFGLVAGFVVWRTEKVPVARSG